MLTQDKSFKKYAKQYAEDQDLFFKEFVLLSFDHLSDLLTDITASPLSSLVSLSSVCRHLSSPLLSPGS